jgi:hypothetical protein
MTDYASENDEDVNYRRPKSPIKITRKKRIAPWVPLALPQAAKQTRLLRRARPRPVHL